MYIGGNFIFDNPSQASNINKMNSKRKFYKTIIQVEVLSEDVPPEFDNLLELHHGINEDWSGDWKVQAPVLRTGKEMAQDLIGQGSDPEFFRLTEQGEDIN